MLPAHIQQIQAAVALVEVLVEGHACVLVLQRAHNLKDQWSGHLAFPGGRFEEQDRDLLACAIRETREECGFDLQEVESFSPLPVALAGRSHGRELRVQPWHFLLQMVPEIRLDSREMQRAFWVRLEDFRDHARHGDFEAIPGKRFPCFWVEGLPLWGFTYGVLRRYLGLEDDSLG